MYQKFTAVFFKRIPLKQTKEGFFPEKKFAETKGETCLGGERKVEVMRLKKEKVEEYDRQSSITLGKTQPELQKDAKYNI